MKNNQNKLNKLIIAILILLFGGGKTVIDQLTSQNNSDSQLVQEYDGKDKHSQATKKTSNSDQEVLENQYYYDKDQVAAYIHEFGHLPDNYITKSEANSMNWSTRDKTYVVGGDRFGNREGNLPGKPGRQYYEADLQAGYTDHRGPERLIFSNDGLIFYTDDHYETFQQLY